MALRDGRLALHGGVFEVDCFGAAVVGDREAGKSTLVAAAAASGLAVLTDDVVVVDDDDDALTIHARPRCIDLREGSAAFFGSRRMVAARGGSRQRMLLGPVAPVAQLAALVVLGWGESLTLSRLS